jgi:hypothetical protein
MPHMNVLDLSVFPGTPRRHCNLARDCGSLHVLKEDKIGAAANDFWHQLPSCKIASGFVQAHRIAQKVINASGGNEFLRNKSFDVGKDFNKTTKGLSLCVK